LKQKIRLGYWDETCRTPLYYPGDSHVILTAPSGAGKGRDLLIPALIEYPGSTVVIDPKGQLAAVTGPHRAVHMKQRVFVLNPFNILPDNLGCLTHAGYNPLGMLNPKADSFGADCDSLAEAIVFHEGGDAGSHWTDSARQLVSGVIMMLAAHAPAGKKNLVNLYEIICGPRFYSFCRDAINTGDLLISGRLGRFAAHEAEKNKELVGIVSTAITQCSFMGNLAIANSLRGTTPELRFSDLRQRATTVYLVLPTRYLATCAKWFRLVIAAAMAELLQEDRGQFGVLALLDEFAQLGTLKVMSDIMGIGRGYGLQLWPVLQDLGQLEELYPKRWQTFLGNAGAQIFFAPRDMKTAEYVSSKCGDSERSGYSKSVSQVAWGPKERADDINVNYSYSQTPRKFMLPHEVAQIGGDEMLVFGENIPGVMRAGRKAYWRMKECQGKYSPDPYHS
jgi:type IV secretion system protein VirD4